MQHIDDHHQPSFLRPHDIIQEQRKVKFVCSFGGKIMLRPHDSQLRYVGGENRVLAVNRNISLSDLMEKLTRLCGKSVMLKYQLPHEDMDSLVSVLCSEDLENMMDEYDHADGSGRLKLFLFPAKSQSASSLDQFSESLSLRSAGQQFVDVVNGFGVKEKSVPSCFSQSQLPNYLFELDQAFRRQDQLHFGLPSSRIPDTEFVEKDSTQPSLLNSPPILPPPPLASEKGSGLEEQLYTAALDFQLSPVSKTDTIQLADSQIESLEELDLLFSPTRAAAPVEILAPEKQPLQVGSTEQSVVKYRPQISTHGEAKLNLRIPPDLNLDLRPTSEDITCHSAPASAQRSLSSEIENKQQKDSSRAQVREDHPNVNSGMWSTARVESKGESDLKAYPQTLQAGTSSIVQIQDHADHISADLLSKAIKKSSNYILLAELESKASDRPELLKQHQSASNKPLAEKLAAGVDSKRDQSDSKLAHPHEILQGTSAQTIKEHDIHLSAESLPKNIQKDSNYVVAELDSNASDRPELIWQPQSRDKVPLAELQLNLDRDTKRADKYFSTESGSPILKGRQDPSLGEEGRKDIIDIKCDKLLKPSSVAQESVTNCTHQCPPKPQDAVLSTATGNVIDPIIIQRQSSDKDHVRSENTGKRSDVVFQSPRINSTCLLQTLSSHFKTPIPDPRFRGYDLSPQSADRQTSPHADHHPSKVQLHQQLSLSGMGPVQSVSTQQPSTCTTSPDRIVSACQPCGIVDQTVPLTPRVQSVSKFADSSSPTRQLQAQRTKNIQSDHHAHDPSGPLAPDPSISQPLSTDLKQNSPDQLITQSTTPLDDGLAISRRSMNQSVQWRSSQLEGAAAYHPNTDKGQRPQLQAGSGSSAEAAGSRRAAVQQVMKT